MQPAASRLLGESSPYLLAHAAQPIPWYPWCDEAFEEAARRDVPVFLSSGYASCHWCHRMAEEAFSDPIVAELLGAHFVSVKVDREQRPDVDAYYMRSCVALSGEGGWPLTALLLPDRRPFFAGTYFPARTQDGRTGLRALLSRVAQLWQTDRARILTWADELSGAAFPAQAQGRADAQSLCGALEEELLASQDRHAGGIGRAPKFPNVPALRFLMAREQEACPDGNGRQTPAGQMLHRAAEAMARGGIHDLVGGGFFRYAADAMWRAPHFEKMLVDNAQLALLFLRCGMPDEALDAADYMLDALRFKEGGLYSSQDADDPRGEGAYYLLTPEQVEEALGPQDGARCCALLHILHAPGARGARGVLPYLDAGLREADEAFLRAVRPRLRELRARRPAPRVVPQATLTANALAILAFSTLGRQLGESHLVQAAAQAARFVGEYMVKGGRLYGAWSAGEARSPATLDGYAAYALALFSLSEADRHASWRKSALRALDDALRLFVPPEGPPALTGEDVRDLPVRVSAVTDDSAPSGAALLVEALVQAHRFTGNPERLSQARRIVGASLPAPGTALLPFAGLLTAQMALEHAERERGKDACPAQRSE